MLSLRAEFALVPALAGLLWFPAGNWFCPDSCRKVKGVFS